MLSKRVPPPLKVTVPPRIVPPESRTEPPLGLRLRLEPALFIVPVMATELAVPLWLIAPVPEKLNAPPRVAVPLRTEIEPELVQEPLRLTEEPLLAVIWPALFQVVLLKETL